MPDVRQVAAAVRAGVDDVLMANVVTDRTRLASLARSAMQARVTVAVDSPATADMASEASLREGVVLSVVIEYDIGMHRSGVESIAEAVALAEHVATLRGVTFRGLMAYEGHLVKVADRAARTAGVLAAFAPMPALLGELREHGFDVQMFTGGQLDVRHRREPAVHDRRRGRLIRPDGRRVRPARAGVRARAGRDRDGRHVPPRPAVVDVGSKRIGSEAGRPVLAGFRATHDATSEEHNRFLVEGSPVPGVGDHVAVVPGHTCSTVALYRTLRGCRGGRFERLLEIDGRDPLA